MRVLETIAGDPLRGLTMARLQRQLHYSHGNLHAILSSLEASGHVRRDPITKAYTLGPALLAIGNAARETYSSVEKATPLLEKLAADLDTETQVTMPVGGELLMVARVGPVPPVGYGTAVGERVPLSPPIGGAYMAWASPEQVEDYLSQAVSNLSAKEIKGHRQALKAIRQQGYSVIVDSTTRKRLGRTAMAIAATGSRDGYQQELEEIARELAHLPKAAKVSKVDVGDVVGLGAPVFGPDGLPELIVTVSFVAPRMAHLTIAEVAAALLETTKAITTTIGGRRPL
jgi:DNA-binding IclR family transcriptional regulator